MVEISTYVWYLKSGGKAVPQPYTCLGIYRRYIHLTVAHEAKQFSFPCNFLLMATVTGNNLIEMGMFQNEKPIIFPKYHVPT